MTDYIQVMTTTDKNELARSISKEAVKRNLAACAQIVGPIKSIYRWEGTLEEAEEWLLLMKTRKDLYRDLEKLIMDVHTYEVPEIIALPVFAGNAAYLKWLDGEVKKD